jgi:hypothetical protein
MAGMTEMVVWVDSGAHVLFVLSDLAPMNWPP